MAIIAFASGKGGVSKTTLAASLASLWHQQGKAVACIDADPNGHLLRWIERMALPGLSCVAANEEAVSREARRLAETHDIVVVDLAGVLSLGLAKVAVVASAVLIPSKAGDGDTVEATRTYRAIEDLGMAAKAAAVITQADPRTAVAQHARGQLADDGVPLLSASMAPRVAYQEAWIRGIAPAAAGNAALTADIEAIGAEALSLAGRA